MSRGTRIFSDTRGLGLEKVLAPTHGGKNILVALKINRLKESNGDIVVVHIRLLSKPSLQKSRAFFRHCRAQKILGLFGHFIGPQIFGRAVTHQAFYIVHGNSMLTEELTVRPQL